VKQPLLMRDYLHPFEAQITEFAAGQHAIVDQAILVWKLFYYAVSKQRRKHEDWIFLRHEDLSRNPLGQFKDLYAKLDLDFSPQVQTTIKEHTDASNPSEVPSAQAYALKRDSKSLIWNWQERLTAEETEKTREQTWEIAKEFYSNEDW
jgi:hypothetical protein